MTGTETRRALIDAGLKALLTNGYDGVGIGPILASVQVPKGSFYYFFPSKEAFVCAVLDAYAEQYRDSLAALLDNPSQRPLQRLEAYFDALEGELRREQPVGGCLYGVIAQTLAMRGEPLRTKVRTCFTLWEDRLAKVMTEAEAEGDLAPGVTAIDAAAFLIDAYEGTLIRMKAEGSFQPYERFRRYALRRLFR